ncbi:MAG: PAS domain-containing sensor histidine kinase [Saprospiraceae bacterium]
MTIKTRYFLFIAIIHIVVIVLSFQLLKDQKIYFFLIEIGVLLSLFLAYQIYQTLIQPLQFMYTGLDAIRDQDFNIKFVETGSKEMDALIRVYNEMIQNIRQERVQVEEQHYFLNKLINASPAGIVILDYDDHITEMNPKAEAILQLNTTWKNKALTALEHPLLLEIAQLETGASKIVSLQSASQFKVEVSHFIHRGFKRKFLLFQEVSQEILAAEKRAYGKIIRMMAHEVNNSIGAINSILHSTVDYFESINADQDIHNAINIAIDRNDSLNQFMRNFATVVRLPPPHFEPTNLNDLVLKVAQLMQHQAKAIDIDFSYYFPERTITAMIDTKQMEQVLVNIIKNALESIEHGGKVCFKLQASPACLIIEDNGAGIAPENKDRLFTPFYSSKPTGQGVGLTLIREVLSAHQLQFALVTEADGWTRFKITWPK